MNLPPFCAGTGQTSVPASVFGIEDHGPVLHLCGVHCPMAPYALIIKNNTFTKKVKTGIAKCAGECVTSCNSSKGYLNCYDQLLFGDQDAILK